MKHTAFPSCGSTALFCSVCSVLSSALGDESVQVAKPHTDPSRRELDNFDFLACVAAPQSVCADASEVCSLTKAHHPILGAKRRILWLGLDMCCARQSRFVYEYVNAKWVLMPEACTGVNSVK